MSKAIVIVSSYYPPHVGGIEIVVKNHAERLVREGHHVTVITSAIPHGERSATRDGLRIVRVATWNPTERLGAPYPLFSPWLIVELVRAIRHADIVHVHDAFYLSSFFGAVCGRLFRKPVVLTQHVAMIHHPSRFVMLAQRLVYGTTGAIIFKLSHCITTLNDRVEHFLITHRVPRSKLRSLHNGVDLTLFRPVSSAERYRLRAELGLSLTKKIAVFVGRFVPKKGFHIVRAAVSDEYQLVFVGGDAPEPDSSRAVFLGALPQEAVARVYQAADAFVLPSQSEGFPLSVQEAMACGLPVVTTYDEGYARYGLDRRSVWFLAEPTVHNVRETLRLLFAQGQRRLAMGQEARAYAERHFAWPKVIRELAGLYDSLL